MNFLAFGVLAQSIPFQQSLCWIVFPLKHFQWILRHFSVLLGNLLGHQWSDPRREVLLSNHLNWCEQVEMQSWFFGLLDNVSSLLPMLNTFCAGTWGWVFFAFFYCLTRMFAVSIQPALFWHRPHVLLYLALLRGRFSDVWCNPR